MNNIFQRLTGGKVLDVATGSGGFIHVLLQNLKSYTEIIGIDTQERGAAAFTAFQGKNVRFQQMDAARMDFPDASFDTVCIANSLHHMSELPAVLREMLRVLKPGGSLVILEMYRDGQSEAQMTHVLLHHWWATVDTALGITHHKTFTRQQIVERVETLNLVNVVSEDLSDLSDDPKNPEALQQLSAIIDQYQQKAAGLPNQDELVQHGEVLRRRVQEIGFHGATSLVILARKPKPII